MSRRRRRSAHPLVPLALLAALGPPASSPAQPFTRMTDTGPHVTDEYRSLSGAWGDYDQDGDPDLYVASIGATFLYRNDGNESFFPLPGPPTDTTADIAHTMAVWGDYDEDGDLDLYRTTFAVDSSGTATTPLPNQLFRNDAGAFVPVPTSDDSTYCPGASWTDADGDGDLDLFASGSAGMIDLFYRNDGGAFVRRTGLPFLNTFAGGQLHGWLDVDMDGDQDLYVVNHGGPNELWRNRLAETGTVESFELDTTSGLTDDTTQIDFGASWGDYDNDGDMDAFLARFGVDALLRNDGGTFTAVTGIPLVQGTASSSCGAWGDYDNDGDLDLFVPHASPVFTPPDLWRNDGSGTFVSVDQAEVGAIVSIMPQPQNAEWADYDSDGDLDLYVNNLQNGAGLPRRNRLYRNEGTSNHWLHVRLVGVVSNRSAVGAFVRAKAVIGGAPVWQMREVVAGPTAFEFQRELRLHFGLGDASVVDSLRVEWPSGIVQTVVAVAADQSLTVVEPDVVGVADGRDAAAPRAVEPNPFRGRTAIAYALERPGSVEIRVHDVAGRLVRTLDPGPQRAGAVRVIWDGRDEQGKDVRAGIYFVRVRADGRDVAFKAVRAP